MHKEKIMCIYGVWDLLHFGHISYFKKAKSLSNRLIVAVRSDKSCASYKPPGPVINENHRLEIIKSIKYVDNAFIYNGDYLSFFIDHKANSICLSSEYKNEKRFENLIDYVTKKHGIESVYFLDYEKEISSTMIKKMIKVG